MSETAASAAPASATSGSDASGVDTSQQAERGSPGTPSRQAKNAAQPTETKAQPSSAPAKPEMFDVKVDGKVIKMTREELIQHASMGHASDKRFKEAAQLRKQAEAVIGRFRDPKQVISALQDPALGLTKDQIREQFEEWYAKEFIEPEQLSPEQKKLRDAEARLKKYEEDEKGRSEQKLKEEQEAMTSQERESLQGQIIEALQSSDLPKTNFTIRRLAYWMQRNNANGFNAPMEVVVGQVRKEFNTNLRDMVQASDGEVLIKLFEGTDIIQKLRKYDLEQLRKTRQGGGQPAPAQESAPSLAKTDRPPTSAEVNQRIRQLQKTGRY